ncbi:MAG TPA: DUF4831 family protein [Bacteroidales bacterium]|jgi:hypothetical protein|nr:DUF4831 family protein [Bacteroidales bacterium]
MKFLKIYLLSIFLLLTSIAGSQTLTQGETVPLGAIVYSLPSTTIHFNVTADHESFVAGPYAKFAQKYLGIQAREDNMEIYKLKSVEITPYIEADYSANYAVNLGNSKNASANFLEFISQGLIMWSDSYAGKSDKMRFHNITSGQLFNPASVSNNLTSEQTTLYKTVQTAKGLEKVGVQQSQVVEKSIERRAEEAANLIFKLRTKRLEIITGETDATFSGDALRAAIEEINRIEDEYMSLFLGKSIFDIQEMSYDVVPSQDNQKQIYIAFRFSETQGLLPASNIAGRPVVLELSLEDKVAPAPKTDISGGKGSIVYRRPAAMVAKVIDGQNILLQTRVPVYQLGNLLSFPIEVATAKK